MTETAIICHACGAKVRDTHTRCPRCRAVLTKAPVVEAPKSDLIGKVVVGLLAIAVVATAVILWTSREPPVPNSVPAAPAGGGRRTVEPAGRGAQAPAGEIPSDPAIVRSSRLTGSTDTADEASLARFRSTIADNPGDAGALAGAGRVLMALGRPREALGPLKQAMELQPDNWDAAFSYGLAAAGADEWTEAVAGFGRARKVMPEDASTSYDLALARQKFRDYAGAVAEYQAAIGLDSAAVAPRLGLAISLDRLGRASEAADAYSDYLRLSPAGPDADKVQARLRRLGGQ